MTNDYAALVAMLDQAAADLQAEIDAAIDRHGLLVRTADSLRADAAEDDGARWEERDDGLNWVTWPPARPTAYDDATDCPICPQLATDRDDALRDATTAQDERDLWDDIATALYTRSDAVFSVDDPAARAYRAARNNDTDAARGWLIP